VDDGRGSREGEDQRLEALVEAARDRHRARQVPETGAVRGDEENAVALPRWYLVHPPRS
jgi:hypothetical protein